MPRRLLLLVLAATLAPASLCAQEGDEPPATTQEEAKPAPEPEKKPDAFQYFFGRKEKKEAEQPREDAEAAAPAESPEVVPAPAPAAVEIPVAPVPPADSPNPAPKAPFAEMRFERQVPEVAEPAAETVPVEVPAGRPASFLEMRFESQPVPEAGNSETPTDSAKVEPKVDAFQYFFGRSTQPAPQPRSKKKEAERKPVDAFEYFFGKDGKAGDAGESEEASSKPPGS